MAQMPDGRTYLCVAHTAGEDGGGFGGIGKTVSIGLGCDICHAPRLVYSWGLDLTDQGAATPIGAGYTVCERTECPQRAFPPIGRPLSIERDRRRLTPYPTT